MANIRVGAINWDASLDAETYFGYYQIRTLSPAKYRHVTPFYADVIGENKISYHKRTAEEFDIELSYATAAGIDYFAYVYYPDKGSREHISLTYNDCSHRVYELNYARKMHEKSSLRHQIGMSAIVMPYHPYADSDFEELVKLFGEDFYEKKDGRPLAYIFHDAPPALIERINSECEKQGRAKPFYVSMVSSPFDKNLDFSLIDGLCSYECSGGNIDSYLELCDKMIFQNTARNEKCKEHGLKLFPHFTFGWDPSPRIDIPSPWVTYGNVRYHKAADASELISGAKMLSDFVKSDANETFSGHFMAFAWNEFEEGGWICPTYNDDLSINTDRISTFAKIIEEWKKDF